MPSDPLPIRSIYDDGGYLGNNPSWHAEDSEWKADHVASLLSSHGVEPSSVVDIGCGAAEVLSNLAARWPNARMVGWDASADVASHWDPASNRLELRHGDFCRDEHHYDVALMLDVFEHVPDYMGLLRAASGIANLFVFHVPLEMNISSVVRRRYLHSRRAVGHLHYFSAESAKAVLADCGYKVLDCSFTSGARELKSAQRPATHVANVFRSGLEKLSPGLASTTLGGYSLLVLCEPHA